MISELDEKSEGMFAVKEGTLYPILYRLEEEGLVKNYWSKPKGKEVSKKYYRITEEGLNTLEETTRLWAKFSQTVNKIL